jgi:DNA-binding response OmpR family regulator
MPCNILIVENEPPMALSLHHAIEDCGHRAIGIAKNKDQALALATNVDIAIVDVDLEDGQTGLAIGNILAGYNITVLLITSVSSAPVGDLTGALGVIRMPVTDLELNEVIEYVVDRRKGSHDTGPPALRP